MNLLNTKIQTIEGVSRTETFISLDQQTDRFSFKKQLRQ
jgi:Lrp/AsnC family transcriptional regulator for asnA, asnC and gidA